MRQRSVQMEAVGTGTCGDPESPSRLSYQRCNAKKCEPKDGKSLKCKSKIDVVVILDGSGSISEAGWKATLKAGEALVKSFETGETLAQVAVLLYSGPPSWDGYQKCTQGTLSSVDLYKDCNLVWVSHFTTDVAKLASEIPQLKWPKGSTLTSAALASAQGELRTGRDSAQSVVIAITDGRAMNPRQTAQAAKALREQARILWVPVTHKAALADIKTWASKPIADNVLVVRDYEELYTPANINRIVAAACPVVE